MSPGFWLHQAALAWRQTLEQRLRPVGLTPTQFHVLAGAGWLGRGGDLPTQQQVADQAGADRMMTSKVIRVLADRGLIERFPDPTDSRSRRLKVTDDGRVLIRQAVQIVVDLDAELFGTDGDRLRDELDGITRRARGSNSVR